MAGYLSRMIKRANGQIPGIKPLVRSGYGTLPAVSESVTEFEETVTFNDDTEMTHSPQVPQVLAEGYPKISSTSNINERELIETNEEQEVQLTASVPAEPRPTSRESKLMSRRTQRSEELISLVNDDTQNHEGTVSSPAGPQAELKEKADISKRVIETASRQMPVAEGKSAEKAESREDMTASDSNRQVSSDRRTGLQKDTTETVGETRQLISPDVRSLERGFSERLETIRPAEQIYPVNSAGQFRNDNSSPSVSVRVSIGRVEVRAVEQPEPEVQRSPSVPVGPAISLDAYLKSRDEEGR